MKESTIPSESAGADPRSGPERHHDRSVRQLERALLIEPERLYWAVIEAPPLSAWGRRGLLRRRDIEALRYAFEPWIPAPLDEVEARFAPIAPGSAVFIACGVDRDRLAAMLGPDQIEAPGAGTELEGDSAARIPPESARSAGLPDVARRRWPGTAASAEASDPAACPARDGQTSRITEELEFCTGEFIGPERRRLRRRLLVGVLAASVLGSGLVTASLFRVAGATREAASSARAAAASIAADALLFAGVDTSGGGGDSGGGGAELRLTAEVRTLERTRELPSGLGVNGRKSAGGPGGIAALKVDRGPLFIALLARWPEEIPVRVESLSIDQATATIRGRTRSAPDAEALLLAIEGLGDGVGGARWTVQGRSLGSSGEGASFTAALAPQLDADVNSKGTKP